LHTNDAPGALTRLTEMGVEPFLTSSAVSGVLAQRLVRTLCSHCAEPYRPGEEELLAARGPHGRLGGVMEGEFKRKGGCARCGETGSRGRIGVFQFLPMSESVSRLAARGATHDQITEAATAAGMRTLWDDGLDKVAAGLTTVEELARVVV